MSSPVIHMQAQQGMISMKSYLMVSFIIGRQYFIVLLQTSSVTISLHTSAVISSLIFII